MIYPTVHINGTSRDALLDQLRNAVTAIRDARNALAEAAPNARDYYPQGDGAFARARDEHNARDAALKTVADELMEMWERIDAEASR